MQDSVEHPFILFFIFQIPTALSKNIAGLCVLRFIVGVFASATLGTGGACIGDVGALPYLPEGIALWSISAVVGPSIGPLIGSALVHRWGWRVPFWFMCILSGVTSIVLAFVSPESFGKTILYRKSIRLRAVTGHENITSEGELENRKMTTSEIILDLLWRPIEVMIFAPVVLLINIYIALAYSIMYLWFEVYPEVFIKIYGFTLVKMGVAYLAIAVGAVSGAIFYTFTINRVFSQPFLAVRAIKPELFIPTAIVGSVLMPIGLIIFGWSATKSVH